jgi:tetratricopeptide (TPR) repeat protein
MHQGHIYEPAEENPELALRHYGRALELLRAGNREPAIRELQRALQYDPDFSEARDRLKELGGDAGL